MGTSGVAIMVAFLVLVLVVMPVTLWLTLRRSQFDPNHPPTMGDPRWSQAALTSPSGERQAMDAAKTVLRHAGVANASSVGGVCFGQAGALMSNLARYAAYWLVIQVTPRELGVQVLVSARVRASGVGSVQNRARSYVETVSEQLGSTIGATFERQPERLQG